MGTRIEVDYNEATIRAGRSLEVLCDDGECRLEILDVRPVGPDLLYKYVLIHEEQV